MDPARPETAARKTGRADRAPNFACNRSRLSLESVVADRNGRPRSSIPSTGSVTESRYFTMIWSGTTEGEAPRAIHTPGVEPSRWTKMFCRPDVSRLSDPALATTSAPAKPPTITHVFGVFMGVSSWFVPFR